MPAGFRRHLVGTTLRNVFSLWCRWNTLCWQASDHTDIFINQRIECYLNSTINLRPLIPHFMPCYTHKISVQRQSVKRNGRRTPPPLLLLKYDVFRPTFILNKYPCQSTCDKNTHAQKVYSNVTTTSNFLFSVQVVSLRCGEKTVCKSELQTIS